MFARTKPNRSTCALRAILLMGGIAVTPTYAWAQTTAGSSSAPKTAPVTGSAIHAAPLSAPIQPGGPHPLPGAPQPVPKMPDTGSVTGTPPAGPAPSAQDNRPIIGNLKGLVLIDNITKMK